MTKIERPRLIGFDIVPFEADGQQFLKIANRDRLTDNWLPLRREAGVLLQFMDGSHTTAQIRDAVRRNYKVSVAIETVEQLVQLLAEIYVIDMPQYWQRKQEVEDAFRASSVREAAHAGGAYAAAPPELHAQIHGLFEHDQGPGAAAECSADKPLRAILAPHIDFHRGGPTFAWAFKELAEQTKASVFVLIGTSHYSAQRFILTRKDFRTPLGIAKTNQAYVDRITASYGPEVFHDELAHKPEHSLEFHILFLQYLFNHRRPFTIVPILVGSLQDAVDAGTAPSSKPEIGRMVAALRAAEAACGEEVCYIVSGDLAHIGMKFGDPWKLDLDRSDACSKSDHGLLSSMATGQSEKLFEFIAAERDRRRICGFPPTYLMLEAVRPKSGTTLRYDRFVDPRGFEMVSFASMAFYG